MKKVKEQISEYSIDDFHNIIFNWAKKEKPSERDEFLNRLIPVQTDFDFKIKPKMLLDDISGFYKRVEDGYYYEGWGWDNELHMEREWGDESWAEEMDEFLAESRYLALSGNYEAAEKAYKMLFRILQFGEEDIGHLPGDPDYENMLEEELDEHVTLLLRAVYINSDIEERVENFYKAWNEYSYMAGYDFKLTEVLEAEDKTLPELDIFLQNWIDYLLNQNSYDSSLIREAAWLKGGIDEISKLAENYPERFPEAYLDWIDALKKKNEGDTILEVIKKGLSRVPKDYTIRAKIGERLTEFGEYQNDPKLQLKGLKESFYSNPGLEYLIALYIKASELNSFDIIKDECEQRIKYLINNDKNQDDFFKDEPKLSSAAEAHLINALLLSADYEKAFELCKDDEILKNNYTDRIKTLFISYMLAFLSSTEPGYPNIIYDVWGDNIKKSIYVMKRDYVAKYQKFAIEQMKQVSLSIKEQKYYTNWCQKEVSQIIDGIVSNQQRGSYDKAANYLLAMAETLVNKNGNRIGKKFVNKYLEKYPRHRAFKREVDQVLKKSKLFDLEAQ